MDRFDARSTARWAFCSCMCCFACCLLQDEFVSRLRAALPSGQGSWRSFYSSLAGGVVTDSSLMLLPIDDHMVHRGHAGLVLVDSSCFSAISTSVQESK